MKKTLLTFSILTILLTACSNGYIDFNAIKAKIDQINPTTEHPYYRVIGALDFNNEVTNVDATFDKQPEGNTFVPYSRYTEGFYNSFAGDIGEDETVLYNMASHSYWLRAPLKLDNSNFYAVDDKGDENVSCAHYVLEHIIISWKDEEGAANPSACKVYYEELADGGFAIGGKSVHTKLKIDNYPYYPDPEKHPEAFGPWKARDPLPAYKNVVDAKLDVRFEYDAQGWLKKETLTTIGYDYNVSTYSQVSLFANYLYKFS